MHILQTNIDEIDSILETPNGNMLIFTHEKDRPKMAEALIDINKSLQKLNPQFTSMSIPNYSTTTEITET